MLTTGNKRKFLLSLDDTFDIIGVERPVCSSNKRSRQHRIRPRLPDVEGIDNGVDSDFERLRHQNSSSGVETIDRSGVPLAKCTSTPSDRVLP